MLQVSMENKVEENWQVYSCMSLGGGSLFSRSA